MYAAIAARARPIVAARRRLDRRIDLLDDYVAALRAQLDVDEDRERSRILHDPIHGVSSGLPSRILGIDVATIRGEINPSFGGVNPEPIPENLGASHGRDATGDYDLAICNDGDADRLGILDERGDFVSPHKIIALLALYLVREKKHDRRDREDVLHLAADREGRARARRAASTRRRSASSTWPT